MSVRGARSVREQAKTDPRKILVVADDRGAGELLTRLLDDDSWTAELAFSPSAALVSLDTADPAFSAVLLDLEGDTDASTLKALADIRRLPGETGLLPVVVCAWDDTIRSPAWMSGVDGFLIRPFRADDLLSVLSDAVQRPIGERETHRKRQLGLAGS
jgi:DNA-binding response OmpR family regulator